MGNAILAKLAFKETKYVLCGTFDLIKNVNDFIDSKEIYNYDKIFITDLCLDLKTLNKIEKDKTYKVIMKFGNETTTQDSSGEVTITTELPTLSKAKFCAVTEQFIGEIQQVPPMYSAIKKDGQPLYKLAREGVEVRFMYDGTCSLSLLPPHYGKRLERKEENAILK